MDWIRLQFLSATSTLAPKIPAHARNSYNMLPPHEQYFFSLHADLTIANLAATEVGLGSLRLMWWFPIPTLFTLTVINLNDSTSIPYIVSGIPDQHYVFVRENAPPTSCDVYRFQVAASDNPNIQSDVVTRSVPSLPDISPLETSLQHSLEPAQNRFTLNVAFNVSGCRYTLGLLRKLVLFHREVGITSLFGIAPLYIPR